MMKVIGEMSPCHKPSKKPAVTPAAFVVPLNSLGPGAQLTMTSAKTSAKDNNRVLFTLASSGWMLVQQQLGDNMQTQHRNANMPKLSQDCLVSVSGLESFFHDNSKGASISDYNRDAGTR